MNPRYIALTTGVILVLGALLWLALQVRATPDHELPADELALAQAAYDRSQTSRAAPTPPRPTPVASRPARATAPAARERVADRAESVERTAPRPTLPQMRGPRGSRPGFASGKEEGSLYSEMREANKLYDRSDYEGALTKAKKILESNPKNTRMLRIVVSAACIMGEEADARSNFEQLPSRDQAQMRKRCKRYGIEL